MLRSSYIEDYINDPKIIKEIIDGKCSLEFQLSLLQRDNPELNSEISRNLKGFFNEETDVIKKQRAKYIPDGAKEPVYIDINVKWTKSKL